MIALLICHLRRRSPVITSLNNRSRGIINVAVFGNNYDDIRFASKKLRDKLERIKDVSSVSLEGYNPDQINIKVDPNKLNENEITLDEVSNVVRGRNFNLSAGAIELPGEMLVFERLPSLKMLRI